MCLPHQPSSWNWEGSHSNLVANFSTFHRHKCTDKVAKTDNGNNVQYMIYSRTNPILKKTSYRIRATISPIKIDARTMRSETPNKNTQQPPNERSTRNKLRRTLSFSFSATAEPPKIIPCIFYSFHPNRAL